MDTTTRPLQYLDANNNLIEVSAVDLKMVAYKDDSTVPVYVAYARPGTLITEAAWKVMKHTYDANNMIVKTEHATGGKDYPGYDQIVDASTAVSISAISKANPGMVTAAGHGLSTGDKIEITGVGGMIQTNGDGYGSKVYTITYTDSTRFTIGIDTSGYDTYTNAGSIYARTLFGLTYS